MPQFALVYQYDPAVTGPTEGELADWLAFDKEMRDAGVFVYATGFYDVGTARTVSVRDGATVVADGVAVSSGPVVAGMCVVNVPDADAATAWAAKVPTARYGGVDVRPVVEYEG
ncbi:MULTISPECIES: YciI family protein [unclassified Nonomuraea]|uniref:YciI family protein n=1 Tax=Nonomuraea sp. NPDC049725 TaxID=3154508 RepID=UPI0034355100